MPEVGSTANLLKASGRLRAACDVCHLAKSKCSRGMPCAECAQSGAQCSYSPPSQLGRPKGSRNKVRTSAAPNQDPDAAMVGLDAFLQSNAPPDSAMPKKQASNADGRFGFKAIWDGAVDLAGGEPISGNKANDFYSSATDVSTLFLSGVCEKGR